MARNEQTLLQERSEAARAQAWFDADPAPGESVALEYEYLPLESDLPDAPVILDATATPSKIAAFYAVDEADVALQGDEDLDAAMRVTQVLDGQYHASTIADSETVRERIQSAIDTAGDVHERPLFVVKAALIPEFDFPAHGEVLHYHATRGLNRAACDAVICIGAPHPDVDDLRREAALLASGRDDILIGGIEHSTRQDCDNPPVYRKLRYADEQGHGWAVPTKHYTGLVGKLFREARENELEQAVHRARPLLADSDDPVDVYLLTNVPTALPIDEVCSVAELTDPLRAMLPVPEGAIELLEVVREVATGEGPDGFRTERLVDLQEGTIEEKVAGYHRLARLSGRMKLQVTERTVRNWIDALESVGLLHRGAYEHRAGRGYTANLATLKSALSVLSNNAGFKVAAVRRFAALASRTDESLAWLQWAREALDLTGDRCERNPPPTPRPEARHILARLALLKSQIGDRQPC